MKLKQTTSTQRVGRVARFLRESKAVSALEYAILIGVIAVGAAAALTTFQNEITNAVKNAGNKVAKLG